MSLSRPLSLALLGATALAAPSRNALSNRHAARATQLDHDPSPLILVKGDFASPDENVTESIQYSSNWAGAVQTAPPANTTFSAVSGSFTIPTPSIPSGSPNGKYAASAWAGIDGDTYGNAILQAGCDFTYDNGVSYDCWYEWFPNPLTTFPNFVPSAGDTIHVSLHALSPDKGTAILSNKNTGQSVTQTLSAPAPTATLAGQNAEWIVEDFSVGGGLVPFANFGSVTFTECVADAGGQSVGTEGAAVLEIVGSGGGVVTGVDLVDGESVRVSYQ